MARQAVTKPRARRGTPSMAEVSAGFGGAYGGRAPQAQNGARKHVRGRVWGQQDSAETQQSDEHYPPRTSINGQRAARVICTFALVGKVC